MLNTRLTLALAAISSTMAIKLNTQVDAEADAEMDYNHVMLCMNNPSLSWCGGLAQTDAET